MSQEQLSVESLRICIVCHPSQGGSGILATELGMALAERGHEVHFVSHTIPFRLDLNRDRVFFHKVNISNYPLFQFPPYSIALSGTLVSLMQELHFDILHVHYAIPLAASAFLSREILREVSPPLLVTLHGTDVTVVGADKPLKSITSYVLENCDGLTAVSESLRKMSIEQFDLSREVQVIPNFVNTEQFKPTPGKTPSRQRLESGSKALIGHMSNFRPVKRIPDVIEIFRKVREKAPAQLVLIGDGPELSTAINDLVEYGLKDDFLVLGSVHDAEHILPQLDVFLLPSEQESFGLAALEAMSSGVPCVVSRTGGLPELVSDAEDGFLLPVGDTDGMAEAILKLLGDPSLRDQMGHAARRSAIEKFSRDAIVSQYEVLYRRMVAARNKSHAGQSVSDLHQGYGR